jgi:hypothetical protein
MTNSEKQFIEQASPEFWYSYARELADAAEEIYRKSKDRWIAYSIDHADGTNETYCRPFVSRPVLLLHGLSFENLIKGLLISEAPTLLNGGKLSKHLLGHDLVKLTDRLRTVQLSREERNLLALLSDVVPYHGRYPVPRAAQDLKPERYISDDIHQECKVLFDRLELQLYRLNFEGIDAPEGVRFSKLRLTHRDGDADFVADEQKFDYEKSLTDFIRKIKGFESK